MKILKSIVYIFFAALLVMGVYIFYKASTLEDPTFVKFEKIKFKNVTLPPDMKVTFLTDAVFNNPNSTEMNISKVEFDIFVDGEKTSHVVQEMEAVMKGNSNFSLPLSFEVPIKKKKDFFKNWKDRLNGAWKNQSINIRTKGKVTLRAAKLHYDIDFDYDDEYRLADFL